MSDWLENGRSTKYVEGSIKRRKEMEEKEGGQKERKRNM